MLTKRESDFVQEYKLTGNAAEAVRRSGYKISNPKSAGVIGCRLLKRPHIAALVSRASVNQELALVSAVVKQPPKELMRLPTKDEYLLRAWERSEETIHSKKEETRAKYFELAGKGLGIYGEGGNNTQVLIYNPENLDGKVNMANSASKISSLLKAKMESLPKQEEST